MIHSSISNIFGGSTISINGVTFHGNKSISIVNNKVFVDGKEQYSIDSTKGPNVKIDIVVTGSAESVSTSTGSITVKNGVKGNVSSTSGNVDIYGDVSGYAKTVSGDLKIHGDVHNAVTTVSGDISARTIEGNCSSVSGSISGKR